jgi:O-phosphoseryl-tRNA(Cys) synthetase
MQYSCPLKQKNEELKNALQCADKNRAEQQGDSHHYLSLGSSSCVVVEDPKKRRARSRDSGKAVRKHVICSGDD